MALVFLLWFAGLALAGLGILPAGEIPLGRSFTQAPVPLTPALRDSVAGARVSAPPGSPAVARPQTGLQRGQAGAGTPTQLRSGAGATHTGGQTAVGGRGHGAHRAPTSVAATSGTTATATTPHNAAAPGQTRKSLTPGHTRSTTSSGHVKPSKTTTTTTSTTPTKTRGKPGSALGYAVMHGRANASNG